jgi:polyhydroxyalkanoate synthesis regulator phasin
MEGALAQALISGAFQLIELGMSADEVNTTVDGWVKTGMNGEQIRDAIHALREERRAQAHAAAEEARKRII